MSGRVLVALALVVSCSTPAYAERCARYVPITTPCSGLGGPRARIIAGRAAVPALAACAAKLDAEQRLRIVDARAAAERIAVLERRIPRAAPTVCAPAPRTTSPLVWLAVGLAAGIVAGYAAATLTTTRP